MSADLNGRVEPVMRKVIAVAGSNVTTCSVSECLVEMSQWRVPPRPSRSLVRCDPMRPGCQAAMVPMSASAAHTARRGASIVVRSLNVLT